MNSRREIAAFVVLAWLAALAFGSAAAHVDHEHPPVPAAYADAHFVITKRDRGGRTVTEVTTLDREGRIVELAQMLAGTGGGTTALASARELLDRSEAWRAGVASSG